jgi:hypothetical protein
MDELNRDMTSVWAGWYQEIRTSYPGFRKRIDVLNDYFHALIDGKLIAPQDALEAVNLFGRIPELQAEAGMNQEDVRKSCAEVKKRCLVIAERLGLEAADNAARHPAVAKLLGHLTDLNSDIESSLGQEILLGREMADMSDKVGGAVNFRALLEAGCPWMKWADAELFMTATLDSPLAAKLDEQD